MIKSTVLTYYSTWICIPLLVFSIVVCADAQLPNTNIYTLDMKSNEQKVLLDNLTLISGFNSDGYNNQPYFLNNEELLITSNYNALGLTDIWHLALEEQKLTRITKTEESEYSPTAMANGLDFSVVRQELDDSPSVPQVLWSYPMDRSTGGTQVIADLDNIGYHAWVTPERVVFFLVDEPSELLLYDTKRKTSTHIAFDVGRCIKVDKKGHIYYVQITSEGQTIRSYDIYLGRSKRVADTIAGQVDFDLLPNGHLIAADGAQLKTFIPFASSGWSDLMDLSSTGIKKISRIASSRGKLAIVTSE